MKQYTFLIAGLTVCLASLPLKAMELPKDAAQSPSIGQAAESFIAGITPIQQGTAIPDAAHSPGIKTKVVELCRLIAEKNGVIEQLRLDRIADEKLLAERLDEINRLRQGIRHLKGTVGQHTDFFESFVDELRAKSERIKKELEEKAILLATAQEQRDKAQEELNTLTKGLNHCKRLALNLRFPRTLTDLNDLTKEKCFKELPTEVRKVVERMLVLLIEARKLWEEAEREREQAQKAMNELQAKLNHCPQLETAVNNAATDQNRVDALTNFQTTNFAQVLPDEAKSLVGNLLGKLITDRTRAIAAETNAATRTAEKIAVQTELNTLNTKLTHCPQLRDNVHNAANNQASSVQLKALRDTNFAHELPDSIKNFVDHLLAWLIFDRDRAIAGDTLRAKLGNCPQLETAVNNAAAHQNRIDALTLLQTSNFAQVLPDEATSLVNNILGKLINAETELNNVRAQLALEAQLRISLQDAATNQGSSQQLTALKDAHFGQGLPAIIRPLVTLLLEWIIFDRIRAINAETELSNTKANSTALKSQVERAVVGTVPNCQSALDKLRELKEGTLIQQLPQEIRSSFDSLLHFLMYDRQDAINAGTKCRLLKTKIAKAVSGTGRGDRDALHKLQQIKKEAITSGLDRDLQSLLLALQESLIFARTGFLERLLNPS